MLDALEFRYVILLHYAVLLAPDVNRILRDIIALAKAW